MWNLASLRHGLAKAQEHKSVQSEQMEQPFSEMQASLNDLATAQEHQSLQSKKMEQRVSEMQARVHALAEDHNRLYSPSALSVPLALDKVSRSGSRGPNSHHNYGCRTASRGEADQEEHGKSHG